MGAPHISNSGAFIKAVPCGGARVTAAGAGDATKVTGETIDREAYGSAKLSIAYKTTLGASATLTFAVERQESANGTDWDAAVVIQDAAIAKTGAVTGFVGSVSFDMDFAGYKRYVRFNVTPDLSAGSADTADFQTVAILGGARALPAA